MNFEQVLEPEFNVLYSALLSSSSTEEWAKATGDVLEFYGRYPDWWWPLVVHSGLIDRAMNMVGRNALNEIASEIIADLDGRAGIHLHDIDDDVMDEIISSLGEIISSLGDIISSLGDIISSLGDIIMNGLAGRIQVQGSESLSEAEAQ